MPRRLFLAAVVAFVPAVAQALSCAAPNPVHTINWHAEADRPYAVLIGTLRPAGTVPKRSRGEDLTAGYVFEGQRIDPVGGNVDTSTRVRLTDRCIEPWCSPLPSQPIDGMFIVVPEGDLYTLETGPCTTASYALPSDAELEAIQRCVAAGLCGPAEFDVFDQRYR